MRNEKGFTLIELLVVIAIIGILAAIAIPQFAEYKIRAFNSRAQSDLRNGLTAQEAYFVDEENYLDCDGTSCEDLPGFVLSDDVELDFNVSTTGDNFAGASCHPRGDKTYDWVSSGTDAGIVQSRDTGVGACTGLPTVPTI